MLLSCAKPALGSGDSNLDLSGGYRWTHVYIRAGRVVCCEGNSRDRNPEGQEKTQVRRGNQGADLPGMHEEP